MLCNHMSKALLKIFYHHCFSVEHSLRVMEFSCKQWLDEAWIMQNKLLISAITGSFQRALKASLHNHLGCIPRQCDTNCLSLGSGFCAWFSEDFLSLGWAAWLQTKSGTLGIRVQSEMHIPFPDWRLATHSLSVLRMGCGISSVFYH